MKFDHLVYWTLTGPIPILVGGAMLVFGPKPPNDLVLSSLSEATGFAPITLFRLLAIAIITIGLLSILSQINRSPTERHP